MQLCSADLFIIYSVCSKWNRQTPSMYSSAYNICCVDHEKSISLPFFYVMTGSNTVSDFSVRGKRMAWEIWNFYPKVITTFAILGSTTCS